MARQCLIHPSSPDFWSLSSWSARLLAPWFLLGAYLRYFVPWPLRLKSVFIRLPYFISPWRRSFSLLSLQASVGAPFRLSRSIQVTFVGRIRASDWFLRLPLSPRIRLPLQARWKFSFLPWPPFPLFPRIRSHRAASRDTISRWLVEYIKLSGDDSLRVGPVRAHDTRSLSTTWALFIGAPLEQILTANSNTFIACYLKDVIAHEASFVSASLGFSGSGPSRSASVSLGPTVSK